MRAKDLKEVVRAHLRAGSGTEEIGSLYIEGPPGIGKSAIVAEVAEEEGVGCIDFRLLLRDPTDLRGIPIPDFDHMTAMWLPPSELPGNNGHHTERGILFFDDMVTAPPLVQASAYQITLFPHRLGEYQLPPKWVIIGAGNRAEDRSLVHRMPLALRDRFFKVVLEVHLGDWTSWASTHGIDATIISFLNNMGEEAGGGNLLYALDPQRDDKGPTPRSWAIASNILKQGFPPHVEQECLEGTIGLAAGDKFSVFRSLFNQLPNPDDILVRKRFQVTPKRIDHVYALVGMVAQRCQGHQVDNAVAWASHLPEEFGVLLVKILMGKYRAEVGLTPSFKRWVEKHADVLVGL